MYRYCAILVVMSVCTLASGEVRTSTRHFTVKGKPCVFYTMKSGDVEHTVRYHQNRVTLRPNILNWYGHVDFLKVRYGKKELFPCASTIRFTDETARKATVEVVWKTGAGDLTGRFTMRDGRECVFVTLTLPPGKARRVQLAAMPSSSGGGWSKGRDIRKRRLITTTQDVPGAGRRDVRKTLSPKDCWMILQDDHFDVAKTGNKSEGPCSVLYDPAELDKAEVTLGNYFSYVRLYPKGDGKTDIHFALWDFQGKSNTAAARAMKPMTPAYLRVGPAPLPASAFKPNRSLWRAVMPYQATPKPFTPKRTLYVSPKGDDKNNGLSLKRAFRTLSAAAKAVKPGDLVLVKGGEYFEHVHLTTPGTKENPIVFRAAPGETAIVTVGRRVKGWRRVEGTRFCWTAPYGNAAHMVIAGRSLVRYATVHDAKTLDEMPGSFYFEPARKRVSVHCLEGISPEQADIRVIDYSTRTGAGALAGKLGYAHDKGLWPRAEWNRVEGFFVEFQPIAVQLRASNCEAWNITAYGNRAGVTTYLGKGQTIANCRGYLNDRYGVHVSSGAAGCRVLGNLAMLNTPRGPLSHSGSGGHPHDLALYGGVLDPTWIGNVAVSWNPSRSWRFKSAKGKVTVARNIIYKGNAGVNYGDKALYEKNAAFGGRWRVRTPPYGDVVPSNAQGKATIRENLYLRSLREVDAAGLADPGRYDFRPRRDCKHKGQGPWGKPALLRYVSEKGTDSADGRTPSTAWKSMAKAVAAAAPGETVYVMPGVYKESLELTARAEAGAPTRVRTWNRGKVVVVGGLAVRNAANVEVDGFIFTSGVSVSGSEGVYLNENVIDTKDTALTVSGSRDVVIENQTIANAATGVALKAPEGRVTLRNTLFSDVANALDAASGAGARVLSERNAFRGANAAKNLAAWRKQVEETHPSMARDVELNDEYQLPENHYYAFAGIGHRPIGARGAVAARKPVVVEGFRVASVMPTSAVMTWYTPFEYANARVSWSVAGGKRGTVRLAQESLFKRSRQNAALTDLIPGAKVNASLTLWTADGRRTQKRLAFKTPEKMRAPVTLYVNRDGDDANDGRSRGKALETLTAAAYALRPGDTLLVGPGVYCETLQVLVGGLSAEKRLTLRSEQPGGAIIDCGQLRSNAIWLKNVKHVTVSGFRFRGLTYSSIRRAVRVDKVSDFIFENCVFEPRARKSRACSQQLLYMVGCKDVVVRDCLFYSGFTTIWGVRCDNVTVDHNTFFCAGINSIYLAGSPKARFQVTNNIFEDITSPAKRHPAVKIKHMNPDVVCDYNLHFWRLCKNQHTFGVGHPWRGYGQDARTIGDARKRYGVAKHSKFGDPLFRDPLSGDFRVKSASPVLKMGSDGGRVGMRTPCREFSK